MSKKVKKREVTQLYSRDGMTMYKVQRHPIIAHIFNSSIKICTALAEAGKLPHKVFVEEKVLRQLNKDIFNQDRTRIVEVFMSPHHKAQSIIRIEDVKWAPKDEDLYSLEPANQDQSNPKT